MGADIETRERALSMSLIGSHFKPRRKSLPLCSAVLRAFGCALVIVLFSFCIGHDQSADSSFMLITRSLALMESSLVFSPSLMWEHVREGNALGKPLSLFLWMKKKASQDKGHDWDEQDPTPPIEYYQTITWPKGNRKRQSARVRSVSTPFNEICQRSIFQFFDMEYGVRYMARFALNARFGVINSTSPKDGFSKKHLARYRAFWRILANPTFGNKIFSHASLKDLAPTDLNIVLIVSLLYGVAEYGARIKKGVWGSMLHQRLGQYAAFVTAYGPGVSRPTFTGTVVVRTRRRLYAAGPKLLRSVELIHSKEPHINGIFVDKTLTLRCGKEYAEYPRTGQFEAISYPCNVEVHSMGSSSRQPLKLRLKETYPIRNPNRLKHFIWLEELLKMIVNGSAYGKAVDRAVKVGERATPLFVVAGICPNVFCGMSAIVVVQRIGGSVDYWWLYPQAGDHQSLEWNTVDLHHSKPYWNEPIRARQAYDPIVEKFVGMTAGNLTYGVDASARAFVEEGSSHGSDTRLLPYLIWQEEWGGLLSKNPWVKGKIYYQRGIRFFARQFLMRKDKILVLESIDQEEESPLVFPPPVYQRMRPMHIY